MIRAGDEGDVDAIVGLSNRAFPDERITRDAILRTIGAFLVKVVDGTVIGCVQTRGATDGMSRGTELRWLAVDGPFRGNGYGPALLEDLGRAHGTTDKPSCD